MFVGIANRLIVAKESAFRRRNEVEFEYGENSECDESQNDAANHVPTTWPDPFHGHGDGEGSCKWRWEWNCNMNGWLFRYVHASFLYQGVRRSVLLCDLAENE